MRALVYDGELTLRTDYPQPVPPRGEALVQVSLAGICNTDLEIMRGYMGFKGILGHEFVGVVECCEDPSLVGQRIVSEINCSCGTCPTCLAGRPTHCPQRTTLGIWGRDGAMAEYCAVPARNLHVVPDSVSDEQAVFTEPLAAALQILEQVHLRPTEHVVVLGDGKLGLLVAQVMRLTGCDLLAVGRHTEKLAILERQGIPTRLANNSLEIQADVVVDCTGTPDGFASARAMVRPRGTLVLKSTFQGQKEVDLTSLVVDEIKLVGSRCGPFGPALRLLDQRLVDVEPLITATYPVEEGIVAFEQAGANSSIKVVLRP
jgi:alcohol dehydrogenase